MYHFSAATFQQSVTVENVFLVDGEAVTRSAVFHLLGASGFSVRAFTSAESFPGIGPFRPQPASCSETKLAGLTGLELQQRVREESAISVVFIARDADVATVVRAMKGGALDFLMKPVNTGQLVAAVARGLELSIQTEAERRSHDGFVERVDRLTRREHEVAHGLMRGLLNKQIAWELGTKENTVKVHRRRVMAKLEVGSVAELVRMVESARSPDVLMETATATRPGSPGSCETRRIQSAGFQPKWRATC